MITKIKSILGKSKTIKNAVLYILNSRMINWMIYKGYMSDTRYLIKKYKETFGEVLNIDNPVTFNEKNNWRKIHERNDLYTLMVDKYRCKKIVEERTGSGHTIPLLGVWDNPKDIKKEDLPNQFVLKANHAGGVIVCRDKETFDIEKAKKELAEALRTNYFIRLREWPYKNVERKIIAEEYVGENLVDYKNYCFNGKLKYTFVWKNKSRVDGRKPVATFCGAYDRLWEKSEIKIGYPSSDEVVPKPDAYDEMICVAEKMSEGIPFVRVDCYVLDNKVVVGEMTFFPWGGFEKFIDKAWDEKLGSLMKL